MAAHAYLSASGSQRWLACTPSAHLEQQFEDATSVYAKEGTFAHGLAELKLQLELKDITKAKFNRELKKLKKNEFYCQEMEDYLQGYVDFVIEKINGAQAKTKDPAIFLEQRVDFSPWVPKGFGTGDVVIIADNSIEVIDLKYGRGVPVSAEGNTQMRMYGLGAINQFGMLYDFENVTMTIVQPRLDSISTEKLTVKELVSWADKEVKPRADLAWEGKGEYIAGEHCRFCKARYTCRTRAEKNLELAKHEFQDPPLLSLDEVGEILAQAAEMQKWVKDVQDYALGQAEKHGVKFPGWKLVEGRSNRKYLDSEQVAGKLVKEGYKEDEIFNKKILGITAMGKLLGKKKFDTLLADLVVKPPGKPTLVPVGDKRPEINSVAAAVEDFKNN